MAPLTDSLPKPLLPVGNVPLIGYALRLLSHHGITEVAVNVHHLADKIEAVLGDGSEFGVNITYSREEEILGTGGGLKQMQEFLNETFVVVNSDTIFGPDLSAALAVHRENRALATMLLRNDPRQSDFGLIEIDSSGRIRKILGQGEAEEPLRPHMFTGVHIMEPAFLDYIPSGVNTCVNRYAYPKALQNGDVLMGVVCDDYWIDVGTPPRYLQANADALDRRMNLAHIDPLGGFALAPTKNVAEVIRMGSDVQLGEGARLLPPVVLGDGVRIGGGAVVGPYCVVGAKGAVGKDARISHTVMLRGSKTDNGAVVNQAVIGKKATLQVEEPPPPPEAPSAP